MYKENLQIADIQFTRALEINYSTSCIPRTVTSKGELKTVGIYDWTSGFFAGSLWYLYELTGNEKWKTEACRWTQALDSIQYWSGNHDVGFMINCSYGNGYRITGDTDYKSVIINTAESLIKRFNPVTGCLKSWNYRKAWDGKTEWFYPVIIDNMMNLELLFEASKLSGNTTYKDIAITHAKTTMKNHYRPDYSCYHVIDYNTENGAVKDKATCQGFTDESSWARGQAWGLYGFIMCYRETGDITFLDFATNIANYMMNFSTLPEDKIPYWDYNVNQEGFVPEWQYEPSKYQDVPRDVSAAAITSSALFELSTYLSNGTKYYNFASGILSSLSSNKYRASYNEINYFILKHSVGSFPHGVEIDVPINYADYYFLEALLRKKTIDLSGRSFINRHNLDEAFMAGKTIKLSDKCSNTIGNTLLKHQ